MKTCIFMVMILLFLSPAFAEDAAQQGNVASSAQAQIARGFDYINAGEYEKAAQVFEKITKLNPGEPDAYIGLAVSYLNLGDNEVMTNTEVVGKAAVAGRKALQLGADYPDIHAVLGFCYLALNDRDSAIREYEILKNLDSDLADKLKNSIDHHQNPESYVHTGTKRYYTPQSNEESQHTASESTNNNGETKVIETGMPNTAPQSIERDTRGRKVYRDERGNTIDAYDTRGRKIIDAPADEKRSAEVNERRLKAKLRSAEAEASSAESKARRAEDEARSAETRATNAENEARNAERKLRIRNTMDW